MKNMFDISGKVALVTGGSRGIGEMIAEGFVANGAKTYISSRKADACDATAARLSELGECISLPADLSTTDGVNQLADAIKERESQLDILVNNAGATWGASIEEFPESGWDKVMNINLKSVFFLTQQLAPMLRAAATAEQPAKVLNIASIDGIFVTDMETYSYVASKAGLIHLTRRMAKRLAPEHIHVNGIAPGAFASDMNTFARDKPDMIRSMVPSGRLGRPEERPRASQRA